MTPYAVLNPRLLNSTLMTALKVRASSKVGGELKQIFFVTN